MASFGVHHFGDCDRLEILKNRRSSRGANKSRSKIYRVRASRMREKIGPDAPRGELGGTPGALRVKTFE